MAAPRRRDDPRRAPCDTGACSRHRALHSPDPPRQRPRPQAPRARRRGDRRAPRRRDHRHHRGGTEERVMNIAGRAGAFSARRWKRATIGWLLFAIAAVVLGSAVGAKSMSDSDMASGETAKAERMLAFFFNDTATTE